MHPISAADLVERLRDYVATSFLGASGAELAPDAPLMSLNIIDSFSMLELVEFLRRDSGVIVPVDQIRPDNFETIERITQLVERLQAGAGERAEP